LACLFDVLVVASAAQQNVQADLLAASRSRSTMFRLAFAASPTYFVLIRW
jgi:hypothetical protein